MVLASASHHRSRVAVASSLALAALALGPAVAAQASPPARAAPSPRVAPSASAAVVAPSPARAPRPAAESAPEGLQPLTDAERATLRSPACRTEMQQLVAGQRSQPAAGGVIGGARRLLDLATAASPQTECLRLIVRDTRVFLARTIEGEAVATLGLVARSMTAAAASATPRRLCPSATPVPASLEALRAGPAPIDASAFASGPWRCTEFSPMEPTTRYQYEVRTAPDGQSAEIIARGFPVASEARPAELFVRVRVGDEARPVVLRR